MRPLLDVWVPASERPAGAAFEATCDAVRWMLRLVRRLEPLHADGLAHGKLSPFALITDGPSPLERAVLLDPQAAPDDPSTTPPEHCATSTIAGDMWAIGVMLHRLLTARAPFAGSTPAEVRAAIPRARRTPLRCLGVGDDLLDRVLDDLLAPDPGRRLSSARALSAVFAAWLPHPALASLPPLEDEPDEPTVVTPLPSMTALLPDTDEVTKVNLVCLELDLVAEGDDAVLHVPPVVYETHVPPLHGLRWR
jgi:serine/threonine protein kinase